jgi:hypothetical protein
MIDENFWSLSHKKGVIFFWVDKNNIGLDIELVKPRDTSLIDTFQISEYDKLWWKNWNNFYRLWTCHESMIKYDKEIHYQDGMYTLISYENISEDISGLKFECKLIFWKDSKTYTIVSGKKWDYIYSICYKTYAGS